MEEVLEHHYRHLASKYNDFLTYSPDFIRSHTSKMIEKLELKESDLLVDLGCGTGIYALDILQQVPLKRPIIGVDRFPAMVEQIPDDAPIETVVKDAMEFAEEAPTVDKVLVKETIHHIPERRELFGAFHERMAPGGRMLLVHVPPELDYPLFDQALKRSLSWHANPNELALYLDEAGFDVDRDKLAVTHSIPKDHYFDMVSNRYMSLLTSFEERELEEGLAEMEQKYAGQDTLEFEDRFDYITAIKN